MAAQDSPNSIEKRVREVEQQAAACETRWTAQIAWNGKREGACSKHTERTHAVEVEMGKLMERVRYMSGTGSLIGTLVGAGLVAALFRLLVP